MFARIVKIIALIVATPIVLLVIGVAYFFVAAEIGYRNAEIATAPVRDGIYKPPPQLKFDRVCLSAPETGAQQFVCDARSAATRKRLEVAEITAKSAAACSMHLQGFIEELEGVFSWAHSVYPVLRLFEKYFPLEGCDPGAVSELCLKSRYCRAASVEPNFMVIEFDSRWDDPYRGLHVQFSLDKRSGDSELPFVKVKI
jgi:hypothetical protein